MQIQASTAFAYQNKPRFGAAIKVAQANENKEALEVVARVDGSMPRGTVDSTDLATFNQDTAMITRHGSSIQPVLNERELERDKQAASEVARALTRGGVDLVFARDTNEAFIFTDTHRRIMDHARDYNAGMEALKKKNAQNKALDDCTINMQRLCESLIENPLDSPFKGHHFEPTRTWEI